MFLLRRLSLELVGFLEARQGNYAETNNDGKAIRTNRSNISTCASLPKDRDEKSFPFEEIRNATKPVE